MYDNNDTGRNKPMLLAFVSNGARAVSAVADAIKDLESFVYINFFRAIDQCKQKRYEIFEGIVIQQAISVMEMCSSYC
uniref:ANK_REP_REGION domain-containing protein n=1 Tax=Panagrellus redivivus TaxID=6233 RepID=A0A7E4V4N8_PANRE